MRSHGLNTDETRKYKTNNVLPQTVLIRENIKGHSVEILLMRVLSVKFRGSSEDLQVACLRFLSGFVVN